MKKILLGIACFVAFIFSAGAQILYGTTTVGGIDSGGTIIKFRPATNNLTVPKSFKINDINGSNPSANLVQASDGKLYGMTKNGGSNGYGAIFSYDPSTSTFAKLLDFNNINGAHPYGSLIQASDGKLYGMTSQGGINGTDGGVIFSFDLSTSTYIKLKEFDLNGSNPFGSLVQANDGKLYGLAQLGSTSNGDIFSFDPSTSTYTTLKDFDYINGGNPKGSLVQSTNGILYGMATDGGSNGAGVIFSFDPTSSSYADVYDFDGINGSTPYGNDLIQASDGKLYGMTLSGGSSGGVGNGYGVIFSFDPSSLTYTKLMDLDNNNGWDPHGSLMQATDGKLYGRTDQGGSNGYGTIFSFDPFSSTFTKLKDIDSSNGAGVQLGSALIEIKSCPTKTFYRDADSDGYGNPNISIAACTQPNGYVTDSTDCDDTKASVHPGAAEICGNGIDDNCNGQADENCNILPTISINDVSVNESKGVAVLTVTLSNISSKPVGIIYYTKDGTAKSWGRHKDYQAKIGLLIIPAGSLTGNISIKIIKDNIAEPTEYFDVILFRSLHGTIVDGSGRVTISEEMLITNSKSEFSQHEEESSANGLEIKVTPNPAAYQFDLFVESNNKTDKINMKVMNVQGKLIETRSNVAPGQTIKLGSNYRPGSYFIQTVQGKQRRTIKVIKLSE